MRQDGGSLRRFTVPKAHGDRARAALPTGHKALETARTRYPSSVVHPAQAPRMLVSGHNQAKIGATVQKGPWAGMPIFTLTLEERATCPATCAVWSECYGNSTPFARRLIHGAALEQRLMREVAALLERHNKIAVRLHILGDFYSAQYAEMWQMLLAAHPGLHLFGFTAWDRVSPIGRVVCDMNTEYPARCGIRFSMAEPTGQPMDAVTLWGGETREGTIMCPAQTDGTDCCATCGLCWAPAAAQHAIGFVGHGGYKRRT